MAREFSMPYMIPPVGLLAPAADAAGRTSPYHTLKNALKAYVVVHINQGNAATVTLSLLQAQNVAGLNAVALGATPVWLVPNTAASDQLVAQGASVGFTPPAATNDKIVVFEIEPEACMNIAGGYTSIAVQTGASNAANITEAELFIYQAYQGASAPTTLTN